MKNAILVLANNMSYFKLMVDNLPTEAKDFDFIVVNETRIGDKTHEIGEILDARGILNFRVFTSEEINERFKKEVIDNDFVDDYSMSMNILSLWFVFKYNKKIEKILLLDDDVILREGVKKLFETDHHLFKSNRLSAGPADYYGGNSTNSLIVYEEWFRIFGVEFTEDWWTNVYLKKYANSGQRLIVRDKFDFDRYEQKLKEFFESEIFHQFWLDRRTHTSWYFDERFETFFFLDDLNDELKDSTYLILTKPEKMNEGSIKKMLRSAIIHNATNSHKARVYNLMIERGVIRGDQL